MQDLRLVAARLPPQAVVVDVADDTSPERTGLDLTLSELNIPSGQAGRYLILAKMSMSEAPGGGTARGWLELPDRQRRPLDERGVTYSSPRDPLSPMFTMALVDVPAGGSSLRLKGHSSGSSSASLDGWSEPGADFRHNLQISGPVADGYAVRLTFDHAAHVARRGRRADGADVFIVHRPTNTAEAPVQIDRFLDPASAWNRSDTTLWFKVQETIGAEGANNYDLYFASDVEVQDDPAEVFSFYEDFSAADLTGRWLLAPDTEATVDDGQLRFDGQGSITSVATGPVNGTRWEAQLQLLTAVPPNMIYLAAGLGVNDLLGAGFAVGDQRHEARTTAASQPIRLATATSPHLYAISRLDDQTVTFTQDNLELATLAGGASTENQWRVLISNQGPSGAVYDWVRIRPYQSPEPTVTVGPPLGSAGTTASTFRWRKNRRGSIGRLGECGVGVRAVSRSSNDGTVSNGGRAQGRRGPKRALGPAVCSGRWCEQCRRPAAGRSAYQRAHFVGNRSSYRSR